MTRLNRVRDRSRDTGLARPVTGVEIAVSKLLNAWQHRVQPEHERAAHSKISLHLILNENVEPIRVEAFCILKLPLP